MLRKRPPAGSIVCDDDEPPQKQLAKAKKPTNVKSRILASTLSAAVLAAINPSSDVRSRSFSEYLTSQVCGLTIGWHIFRSVTEGAFLVSYGIAFNTLVVQVFWSMSVGSVFLYMIRRSAWLRWRESICVWTNITYGMITVLKIFNLLDRLPNENHYMFKHCFLTMADAAFSQTPVHKQYMVQFTEAFIRVIVWRRYNVLATTSTWAVVTISFAWQIWLVTFSSMLQARHVSAFRRQHGSGNPTPASYPASPVASRPVSCDVETRTAGASTSMLANQPLAAAPPPVHARLSPSILASLCSAKSPRSSLGSGAAPAAGTGGESNTAGAHPPAEQPCRSSTSISASQKRFMRALRSVARGPSSYVLLSHQRRQAGGPQCASAQFYIPAASPDMLSGNWRERLASAIADGAPGWQVANMCVRKGSLIVHLDLVYAPTGREGSEATATAAVAASAGSPALGSGAPGAGDVGFPGATYSEQPFNTSAAYDPKASLDDYIGGMGAESLLELLGLPSDLPAGPLQPISVQVGDKLKNLQSDADASTARCTGGPTMTTFTGTSIETSTSEVGRKSAARCSCVEAPARVPDAKPAQLAESAAPKATFETWQRLVVLPLKTALRPPSELRTKEYTCFLSERVATLHMGYAAFIILNAVVMPMVRVARTIQPATLMLFISTELLTLAAHAALGRGAWRGVRCTLVYVGVALRTLQMAACTCGFLPHVLRDSDCISGRWIQKVVLITTLQALCMQPPVHSFFIVRAPSVMLSIYVHVFVCQTGTALQDAIMLHLGWEGLLFLISANFQLRHLEAFRSSRRFVGRCQQDPATSTGMAETCAVEAMQNPLLRAHSCESDSGTREQKVTSPTISSAAHIITADSLSVKDHKVAAITGDPAVASLVPTAASGDPYDVSLSAPLVVMATRRAARLQLHFTCAPAIVEEVQVVLRHINPAAMSSGVHAAHAVRDITRALVAPAGAAAMPSYAPAPFTAELTLVASPVDMPGLVHVELWRGRRRVCSHPVLLVAALEAPPADTGSIGMSVLSACAARMEVSGDEGVFGSGAAGGTWLDDIRSYVGSLQDQSHATAADSFVEELGSWLAQLAALERGLLGNQNSAVGVPRVANVLYFHGYGSEFMYVKPRRVSGEVGISGEAGAAITAADPLQGTLRQLLLCQGSMLLAVAVEAGCIALSEHLMGLLMRDIGATLRGLLDSARTPVTQLPLLHAAVKSGSTRMVDLVAEWSTSCGLKDIWAHEAAILAVSLGSCTSSVIGDTVSLEPTVQGTAGSGSRSLARGLRRPSRLLQAAQGSAQRTISTLRALETRSSNGPTDVIVAAAADAGVEAHPHNVPGEKASGSAFTAAGMDTSRCVDLEAVDADIDLHLDVEKMDLSEQSPFKIIDFRASNRSVAASAVQGYGLAVGESSAMLRSDVVTPTAETVTSGGSRSSGLLDGGVLVLTPLHMSLALGDEGRLANHILRTYPEAYELWRISQVNMEIDSTVNVCGDGGNVRLEGCTSAENSLASSVLQPLVVAESIASSAALETHLAAAGLAYSSMPGLAGAAKPCGTGCGGDDGGSAVDDSMEVGSLQSISLSEVAVFEGIRWVNEDASSRRGGFKVVRL